jgi:hypothetical protein
MNTTTYLSFGDYLSILLVILKLSGWLHWTWLQVLALPAFFFLVGFTEGVLNTTKGEPSDEE